MADNRLLANLIKCEKDHHSALLGLLVRSHTALAALSAYASGASPPVAHALRGCIQAFAAADEGLRGYAAAVEGWKEELKEVKRVEDELRTVIKDKDILVGRLIKASKQKIPASSLQAGPAPIPNASHFSSSASSSSFSLHTSQPYHFTPTPHATQHINSKLALAQRELQACEAHLAAKEAELAEVRRSAIAEGMGRRCRAMADVGVVWRERGEQGVATLNELDRDAAAAASHLVSSLAPSHSASQLRSHAPSILSQSPFSSGHVPAGSHSPMGYVLPRSTSPFTGTYQTLNGGYQHSHPLPALPERNSWHLHDDQLLNRPASYHSHPHPGPRSSSLGEPRRPTSLIDPPRAPSLNIWDRRPVSSHDLPTLPDEEPVMLDIPPPHSIREPAGFIPVGRPVSSLGHAQDKDGDRWRDSSSEEDEREYRVVEREGVKEAGEEVDEEIVRAVEKMGMVVPPKPARVTPPTPPDTVSSTSPTRLYDVAALETTPVKKSTKRKRGVRQGSAGLGPTSTAPVPFARASSPEPTQPEARAGGLSPGPEPNPEPEPKLEPEPTPAPAPSASSSTLESVATAVDTPRPQSTFIDPAQADVAPSLNGVPSVPLEMPSEPRGAVRMDDVIVPQAQDKIDDGLDAVTSGPQVEAETEAVVTGLITPMATGATETTSIWRVASPISEPPVRSKSKAKAKAKTKSKRRAAGGAASLVEASGTPKRAHSRQSSITAVPPPPLALSTGMYVPTAPPMPRQPGPLFLPSGTTRSDIGPAHGRHFDVPPSPSISAPAGRGRSGSGSFLGRVAGLFGRKRHPEESISLPQGPGQAWRTRTDANLVRGRGNESSDGEADPTGLVAVSNINSRVAAVDNRPSMPVSGSPKKQGAGMGISRKLTKADRGQTLRVGLPPNSSQPRKLHTQESITPASSHPKVRKTKAHSVDGGALGVSRSESVGRASVDLSAAKRGKEASLMAILEGPGLVLPSELMSPSSGSQSPTLTIPPTISVSVAPATTAAPKPVRATSPMPLKSALRNSTPSPLPPSNGSPAPRIIVPPSQPNLSIPSPNTAISRSPRESIVESVYETGEEDFADATEGEDQQDQDQSVQQTLASHSHGSALAAFKDTLGLPDAAGSVSTAGPHSAQSGSQPARRKSVRINPAPEISATPVATPGSELEDEPQWMPSRRNTDKTSPEVVSLSGWSTRIGRGWEDSSSDESLDEEYERVRRALATSSKHMDALSGALGAPSRDKDKNKARR
ncbi:Proteophosphoglycan ppg4 [Ceratobasidium theobromae]|uniref:Proteophosphoglycan ppg4 n=1 Tax=Ceratobasidium theobromae TaxID=1582974 RepID=A0A5N5QIC5_9AGAM|nr:Proteophosphoglycan ppg4 [Ceratobasidium theobromae]